MQYHKQNADGSVLVVLLGERDLYFQIEGIAAEIFVLLDRKLSLSKIVKELRAKFPKAKKITEAELSQEVSKVAQAFKENGLFGGKKTKTKQKIKS